MWDHRRRLVGDYSSLAAPRRISPIAPVRTSTAAGAGGSRAAQVPTGVRSASAANRRGEGRWSLRTVAPWKRFRWNVVAIGRIIVIEQIG